jgi:hypothetical protein
MGRAAPGGRHQVSCVTFGGRPTGHVRAAGRAGGGVSEPTRKRSECLLDRLRKVKPLPLKELRGLPDYLRKSAAGSERARGGVMAAGSARGALRRRQDRPSGRCGRSGQPARPADPARGDARARRCRHRAMRCGALPAAHRPGTGLNPGHAALACRIAPAPAGAARALASGEYAAPRSPESTDSQGKRPGIGPRPPRVAASKER